MPTLKGTEASLSCVQCFLYLVSCSINVSFSYYMAEYFLDRQDGILFSPKKKEILSFATWMDLEGSMLSEISHTEKTNTICSHLHVYQRQTKKSTELIEKDQMCG